MLVAVATPAAQPAAPNPCVAPGSSLPLRLSPIDEAPSQPGFLAFRTRLQMALARRDVSALRALADRGIRTSFGDDGGLESFVAQLRDPKSRLWADLARTLALGGAFRSSTSFEAPYVFARWPDAADSFACAAVIGSGVRVRARRTTGSAAIARVSYEIVHILPGGTDRWVRVQLATGAAGYVAASLVRSPIDRRAIFERRDGQWRLTAFVAGD